MCFPQAVHDAADDAQGASWSDTCIRWPRELPHARLCHRWTGKKCVKIEPHEEIGPSFMSPTAVVLEYCHCVFSASGWLQECGDDRMVVGAVTMSI